MKIGLFDISVSRNVDKEFFCWFIDSNHPDTVYIWLPYLHVVLSRFT